MGITARACDKMYPIVTYKFIKVSLFEAVTNNAPRLCFQGRRACRGGYLYSSYFAHFVSFVELLKLMEFGF